MVSLFPDAAWQTGIIYSADPAVTIILEKVKNEYTLVLHNPLSMVKISVVIITFNEEKNIKRCIDSVREIADEIVVADSFSTDKTEAICLAEGVKFYKHPFEGYVKSKNYANSKASFNHILSIDADEALSEALKNSILEMKSNWDHDAYYMNRLTNYCGKWIRHGGWYPDRKVRLFDSAKGCWNEALVHEKIVLKKNATVGFLQGDLLHYSYNSIAGHTKQAGKYASLGARELFEKGKKSSIFKLILNPCIKFCKDYFFRLGFLDGYYGYVIARISARATFLKYSELRYLHKKHHGDFS